MTTLAGVNIISPILSGKAIGAIQKLDLVYGKLPMARVDPTAYTGKIWVENSAMYQGSPQVTATALSANYPQTAAGNPTTVTYTCEEDKEASQVIPGKLQERSQFPLPLDKREAKRLGVNMALRAEIRAATLMFTAGNWGTAALADLGTGSRTQWSSHLTARPDEDIDYAFIAARERAYNCKPNTIIMGQQVIDAYRRCLQAQDIQYVTSGAANGKILTQDAAIDRIQTMWGLRVIIGSAVSNTAAPGLTNVQSYIWGKSFWVGILNGENIDVTGDRIDTEANAAMVVAEDIVAGAGVNMEGLTIPVAVRMQETVLPAADGVIVAARCYTDEVVTETKLGYVVTAVAA
jgi:hypothetical protein